MKTMAEEFKRLRAALESSIAGASHDELAFHPEGKWCAAEVLEHLSRTYFGTNFVLRKTLDGGAALTSTRSAKDRIAQFVVTTLGIMPGGRQAPAPTVPKGIGPEQALREIRANFEEMEKVVADAEQTFGSKAIVGVHPVLGPLTAPQWRKFHLAHGLHHCKQIDRLRQQWRARRAASA
jgi:DinB family protein